MDLTISKTEFSKCGTINVFTADGKQLTFHLRDFHQEEEGDMRPEVQQEAARLIALRNLKVVLEKSIAVTDSEKMDVLKVVLAEGKSLWP